MAEFNITAFKGRTTDYQFTLYQSDGVTGVVLDSGDVVRFKLGTHFGSTGLSLDLDSVAATTNGSGVTINQSTAPAKATVRFAQADMSGLKDRVYLGEISVTDNSETAPADAIKHAEAGTVYVQASMGGDVGVS